MVAALLLLAGCAKNSAPYGFLRNPPEYIENPLGGWAEVRLYSGQKEDGELIAVGDDTLVIIQSGLTYLSKDSIESVVLTGYQANADIGSAVIVGGTLSTISHGFIAVLTAPSWVLFGSIINGAHSYSSRVSYPFDPWKDLNKYARYPQGMPPDSVAGTITSFY